MPLWHDRLPFYLKFVIPVFAEWDDYKNNKARQNKIKTFTYCFKTKHQTSYEYFSQEVSFIIKLCYSYNSMIKIKSLLSQVSTNHFVWLCAVQILLSMYPLVFFLCVLCRYCCHFITGFFLCAFQILLSMYRLFFYLCVLHKYCCQCIIWFLSLCYTNIAVSVSFGF